MPSKEEILTIPNSISTTGALLVADGLRRGMDTPLGLTEVLSGRLLDLADGTLARAIGPADPDSDTYFGRATGTSEFGRQLDPALDKLASAAIVEEQFRNNIGPRPVLAALAIMNVGVASAGVFREKTCQGEKLKTSENGKISMFAQNLALGSYAIASTIESVKPKSKLKIGIKLVGHISATISLIKGVQTAHGYITEAIEHSRTNL